MNSKKLKSLVLERLAKKPGSYQDGGGLILRVSAPASGSWVLRYQIDGKRRDMGLGRYPDLSLEDARKKASDARRLKALGNDPIAERRAARAAKRLEEARALSFKSAAEKYIAIHSASWKNKKHALQWEATLKTYVYPTFGAVSVGSVDVTLVTKVLEPIWAVKPETAGRVRGRIESILDWAMARGYRQGENPARWRGHLDKILPARSKVKKVEHHAALPYSKMPAFMCELKAQEGLGAQALQFTIMTAARTDQSIGSLWPEMNLHDAVWTIPGERMKSKREHRVPLSKSALAILQAQHEATGGKGFVFPGASKGKPLSNMAMLATLRRMGRDDITTHGFRSTFKDWATECTNFPNEVSEMALAHSVGDKVEAAYRRGELLEKRRKLAEAWDAFCNSPPAIGNVVPMRGTPR